MSSYSKEVSIDKNNLDEECVRLPSLYEHWADEEEVWRFNYETLVTKRRVVKAEVGLQIRGMKLSEINRKFNLNLIKLTEQVYQDLIYIHPRVVVVTRERDEAYNMYAVAKAARQSFDKKKAMLEYLTYLHGQGYFMRAKSAPWREYKNRKLRKQLAETIEKKETTTRRIKP
jgi:hypothetical protein